MSQRLRDRAQTGSATADCLSCNLMPIRHRWLRTAASSAQWAHTLELLFAIEPDTAGAMDWLVQVGIVEFGGLTGYELVQSGRHRDLERFLSEIIAGCRD
jgi:hypothetical protein